MELGKEVHIFLSIIEKMQAFVMVNLLLLTLMVTVSKTSGFMMIKQTKAGEYQVTKFVGADSVTVTICLNLMALG